MSRLASLLLFAAVFCLSPALSADAWEELYRARLEGSADFRQARLGLAQARLAHDRLASPFPPTLSLGTSGAGLKLGPGGAFSGSIASELLIGKLFGAELGLRASLSADPRDGIQFGDPSLSLSRRLFVESAAELLSAEAELRSAELDLRETELSLRIDLAAELMDLVYNARSLALSREELAVEEGLLAAAPAGATEASRRAATRRLLQARKAMLSAQAALEAVDEGLRVAGEAAYAALMRRREEWTAVPYGAELELEGNPGLRAQELRVAAAETRDALGFLSYLPNPALSAGLSWDREEGSLTWALGLQFSLAILDRGERALGILQRREGVVLERLRLQAGREALATGLRQARSRLGLLELDRGQAALAVADGEEAAARLQALFAGGFTSAEALASGLLELERARLEALAVDHELFLQAMRLAQFFDMGQL